MDMKRLVMIMFVAVGLFSCSHKRPDNGQIENTQASLRNQKRQDSLFEEYRLQDSLYNEQAKEAFVSPMMDVKSDYETSSYIFDSLPQEAKLRFINKYENDISQTIVSYFDKYSTISHVDSIFEVLMACDFSIRVNKELLPFYIHILSDVIENEKTDGYVGESVDDVCYLFLNNYPGRFYQYISFVDNDLKESLIGFTAGGIYFNNMNGIDSIFETHKAMLPDQRKLISSLAKRIKEVCEYYD